MASFFGFPWANNCLYLALKTGLYCIAGIIAITISPFELDGTSHELYPTVALYKLLGSADVIKYYITLSSSV